MKKLDQTETQLLSAFVMQWGQMAEYVDRVKPELFGYQTRNLWSVIFSMRAGVVNAALVEEMFPELHTVIGEEWGLAMDAEKYIEALEARLKVKTLKTYTARADQSAEEGADLSEVISELTASSVGLLDVGGGQVSTDSILESFEQAAAGKIKNVPLPFPGLDCRVGGLRKGMVSVLTGRSKAGKSMLKSFWLRKLGEAGIPALDCCFEDGIEISKGRCASVNSFCLSDFQRGFKYIRNGNGWDKIRTSEESLNKAKEQFQLIDKMPLHWHQRRVKPSSLVSVVSSFVAKHGVQVVFVDGAKDMLRPSGKYNDCGFEEEASQAFVDIAQRLNVAIVVIHHLTKLPETDLITSGNIRGSGNIVSDCRSVFALQSGESLKKFKDFPHDAGNPENIRVLQCLENNHGQTGKAWLTSDLSHCFFSPLK